MNCFLILKICKAFQLQNSCKSWFALMDGICIKNNTIAIVLCRLSFEGIIHTTIPDLRIDLLLWLFYLKRVRYASVDASLQVYPMQYFLFFNMRRVHKEFYTRVTKVTWHLWELDFREGTNHLHLHRTGIITLKLT